MKTKLFILLIAGVFSVNAQTTYDIGWERDITGTGNADLTIEVGDTVRWTWLDNNHTVENDPDGTSVETFNSGFLGPSGSIFLHTFTVIGTNDYYCGVHGAGSMSGTITVEAALSIKELDNTLSFNLYPNPTNSLLNIQLKNNGTNSTLQIFNMLGKQVINRSLDSKSVSQINVSNLQSGLYLIRVTTGNQIETQRFIKN